MVIAVRSCRHPFWPQDVQVQIFFKYILVGGTKSGNAPAAKADDGGSIFLKFSQRAVYLKKLKNNIFLKNAPVAPTLPAAASPFPAAVRKGN
jgi:hypothetical protein